MEQTEDDDDLKLARVSAGLILSLESSLPKLLWKRSKTATGHGEVHRRVRRRDLEYVIRPIEPFQGDPQLLDARLKYIVPPIVEAYIDSLKLAQDDRASEHLDLQSAVCVILYTLCKVRGYNVIVGFFNNEPRYIEPILTRLEQALDDKEADSSEWQVPYILLLWLSHLMLTPFDLASISASRAEGSTGSFPILVERVQTAAITMLSSPTKAQDAAAFLLVRLVTRPDMLQSGLSIVVRDTLQQAMQSKLATTSTANIYELLGPLRYYAGLTTAGHDDRLRVPKIYSFCWDLAHDVDSRLTANAIAKKLFIKIFRNTATVALRAGPISTTMMSMLEGGLVEDVIDYLLTSLGDRDTPVRYAAAKALSRLVLELDPEMGFEVIQAVLDAFQEDVGRSAAALDFTTVNALKWHGLTLTLSHTLFKRSASPRQLPDIISALVSALQFEQRTSTGSSVGTNVRDAANFGLWSMSRRYTTKELLSVDTSGLKSVLPSNSSHSVIQALANQLILSACLDPVGNIRRGSSAALQELIGRHPNKVREGISLVQMVEYQAVGLRRRAMVHVAARVASLADGQHEYWTPLVSGLLGWRGVGSYDVLSREAAAESLASLATSRSGNLMQVVTLLKAQLTEQKDIETLHGLVQSLAALLDEVEKMHSLTDQMNEALPVTELRSIMDPLVVTLKDFTPRLLRSELPSAVARLFAALCTHMTRLSMSQSAQSPDKAYPTDAIEAATRKLLSRQEESIQQAIPVLATKVLYLKHQLGQPLGCLAAQDLSRRGAADSSQSTLNGACGAIALGALAPHYGDSTKDEDGLRGEEAALAVATLASLSTATNVDLRIVAIKALQLAMDLLDVRSPDEAILDTLINTLHVGMNDYTIDERGDIGSLVRLQAIAATSVMFDKIGNRPELLQADIYRLSLEKLDRVRLEAARCRTLYLDLNRPVTDIASVSSEEYFLDALLQLSHNPAPWKQAALLTGIISAAGNASESLLQTSRAALLSTMPIAQLLPALTTTLKPLTPLSTSALSLLAFLLDMDMSSSTDEVEAGTHWRTLLSLVQKSHYRSTDIGKILAAVQVYRGLAEIESVRAEVLKKLRGMKKTNPYPVVKGAVAEVIFVVTGEGL